MDEGFRLDSTSSLNENDRAVRMREAIDGAVREAFKSRLAGSSHPVRPTARESMRDKEILVVQMPSTTVRDLKVEDDNPESCNQASSVSSETEEKVSAKDIPEKCGKRPGSARKLNLGKSNQSVPHQSSFSSLASSDGTVKPATRPVRPVVIPSMDTSVKRIDSLDSAFEPPNPVKMS